jgi:hypothetical protein
MKRTVQKQIVLVAVRHICIVLSWTRTASDRIVTARDGTVRRDKTQWKQTEGRALRRPGSAQIPSVRIGTVPEYRTEQNVPKFRSVRKTNTCFQAKGFYVFLCNNWFLMPIGSEAVRGRSPDPSRVEPCRADPIQCAPSLTVSPTCSIIGLSLTAVEMCMVEKTIPLSSTLHTHDATSDITQFPACSPCDFCGLRRNDTRTHSTASSLGRQLEFFSAQMQPLWTNDLCHL